VVGLEDGHDDARGLQLTPPRQQVIDPGAGSARICRTSVTLTHRRTIRSARLSSAARHRSTALVCSTKSFVLCTTSGQGSYPSWRHWGASVARAAIDIMNPMCRTKSFLLCVICGSRPYPSWRHWGRSFYMPHPVIFSVHDNWPRILPVLAALGRGRGSSGLHSSSCAGWSHQRSLSVTSSASSASPYQDKVIPCQR
jgi:hypothetical protein